MLLHAALGPRGEGLGDLAPRAAGVAQGLEALLLGRRPRRVGAAFLGDGAGQLRRRRGLLVLVLARVVGLADHGGGGVAEGGGGGGGIAGGGARDVEVGDAAFAGIGGGVLGGLERGRLLLLLLLLLLGQLLGLELLGTVLRVGGEGETGGVVGGWRVGVVVLGVWVAEGGGGQVRGKGELGWRGGVGALGGDGGLEISRAILGGVSVAGQSLLESQAPQTQVMLLSVSLLELRVKRRQTKAPARNACHDRQEGGSTHDMFPLFRRPDYE